MSAPSLYATPDELTGRLFSSVVNAMEVFCVYVGDQLGFYRFEIADEHRLYMDGNSLGRLPKGVRDRLNRMIDDWGERMVSGWPDCARNTPDSLQPDATRRTAVLSNCGLSTDAVAVKMWRRSAGSVRTSYRLRRRVSRKAAIRMPM